MKLFQNFGQVASTRKERILAYVFQYTGAAQSVVAPVWANYMTVDLSGAQGGREPNASYGSKGGRVTATRTISGGDTLYVYVGGMGETAPNRAYDDVPIGDGNANDGGFNGGGNGGFATYNGSERIGAGGGGGTDIRLNTDNLASRIVVAGGGGGGGTGAPDGFGGGLVGGSISTNLYGAIYTVGGGTQSAGGAGSSGPSGMSSGNPGSLGQGGHAPSAGTGNVFYANPGGGGGGGGYYGGGSGGYRNGTINGYYYSSGMAGAGGSSYTDGSCTNVVHTQDYNLKHGIAYITFYAKQP